MRLPVNSAAPAPAKELRKQFLKNSRKGDLQIAPVVWRPPFLGEHDEDLGHLTNAIE